MIKTYRLYKFAGWQVVLTLSRKEEDGFPEANFDGTGWALCGRLKKNETIEQFALRAEIAHRKHEAENTDCGL